MRLIDAEALKKSFEDTVCIEPMPYAFVKQIIDNAPTVEPEKVLVANVTFDEDKLKEIVQTEVIDKIKNGELVIQEEKPQVAYLCKYHKEPHYCKHTTRIEDALNFEKIGDGKYIEKEVSHG